MNMNLAETLKLRSVITLYLALYRSGLCVLRLPNLVHELLVKPKVGEASGRLGWNSPGHLEKRGGRMEVRLHTMEQERKEQVEYLFPHVPEYLKPSSSQCKVQVREDLTHPQVQLVSQLQHLG